MKKRCPAGRDRPRVVIPPYCAPVRSQALFTTSCSTPTKSGLRYGQEFDVPGVPEGRPPVARQEDTGQPDEPAAQTETVAAYRTTSGSDFRSAHITLNVPENSSSGHLVGDVSVTDPNGDQLYYGLHHASHLDYQADYFERTYDFGYDNGRITLKQGVVLDYEHESPLTVTIKLTDELDPFGEYDYLWDDTVTLTIKVTNLDEPGTLDLEHVRSTTGAPTEVDVSFARLSDPDGVNRIVSWEWFRGDTQDGPFTEIDSGPFSDGTESGFRPEESDIGKYLKVRVTYADVFSDSSGRTKAIEQTMGPVERWVSPHPDYAFWPGRWHDAGDLAVGGTQTGVIQGGFDANGRYVNDVIDYFELTGMTAGATYQLNLREPGAGGGHIVGFYTTDGAGLYFESRGDMQNDGYGSAQLRQALFTPSSSGGRHFVSIRGVFATQDVNYTVALVAPAADDIPDSVSTAAEGATFGSGVIEKLYDVDWHRTNNLSSSTQYLVYLKGAAANGLFDPYIVGVYDPQGNLIAGTSDNWRGIGRDASVLFTPPSYGRYYIAVSSAPEPFRPRITRDSTGKGHTGAYVLAVTTPSGDASNYRGSTTQRMGPSGGIATMNQEYTFDCALEPQLRRGIRQDCREAGPRLRDLHQGDQPLGHCPLNPGQAGHLIRHLFRAVPRMLESLQQPRSVQIPGIQRDHQGLLRPGAGGRLRRRLGQDSHQAAGHQRRQPGQLREPLRLNRMSLGKAMALPSPSNQAPGTQAWICRQRGGRYHNRDPVSTSSPSPKQRTETRARRRCRPLPTVEPRIGRAGPTNSPLTYGRTKKTNAGRLERAALFVARRPARTTVATTQERRGDVV